jgi:iron complex outermembrane receptor protein
VGFTDADATNSGFRIAPTWGEPDDAQLTAGVDLRYIDQELNEFDDFLANIPPLVFDNYPIPRSHMIDVGLFGELTWTVNESRKFTAGARVDWVQTHSDAVHVAYDPLGDPYVIDYGADVDVSDVLYHGFISVDEAVGSNLTLRCGFGHGQRPPSLTERFADEPFATVVQSATSAILGDPELQPERASQFDLALIGDYDDFRFRATGFWSYINEHITLAPAFGIPPDPDLKLVDFVNDDATLTGFELAAEYDWAPDVAPFIDVRYVSGRNVDRGEPLFAIYPLEARAGLDWYDPWDDRFEVEFAARMVAGQDRLATSLSEMRTAGFTTFDLRGYYQVTDRLRVSAGFENLFDRNYLEHLNVHLPAVLEPGRNFYAAVQMDY